MKLTLAFVFIAGLVLSPCCALAVTVWLEAESFDGAHGYGQDDASGGQIAITNLGSPPAMREVQLPEGGDYRIWVRIADALPGGRRGVVRINGVASGTLSGNGTGLTWYLAGKTNGGNVKIELTGADQSPADCLYDAVLVTDDEALGNDTITARQAELRRAGWTGRGPRIALVHSDYSVGEYRPASAWDGDLAALDCFVEKWPAARVSELAKQLDDYDVVLFTVMYRHGSAAFWNDLGAPLSAWVRRGGMLIVAGGREPGDLGWLRNIHPALVMALGPCPTGMPGTISDELRQPDPLADGLNERPHDYGRLPNPIWPDFEWQHLDQSAGRALVSCPCGKPLLVGYGLDKGMVIAGTLFKSKGLDGRVFENLWAAHAGRLGRTYKPHPPRPSIAEQLADYPGPTGQANAKLTFDQQGTLLIDSEPFFPFGFYCVQHLESLKILSDNGFNCVFGGSGKKGLDEAVKRGIRVVASMSWDPKEIPDVVPLLRQHPAFIGYGILEEPSNTPMTMHDMMLSAAVIRKCDPDKPRYVLPNNPLVFGTVAGMGEFIIADPYCVRRPDSPLNRVEVDVRMLRTLHPGKPVWTILQAHRFGDHLIIPNPAQLRAMNYLAIVAGSRGIMWFAFDDNGSDTSISFVRYADGHYEQPVWDTLCALAKEMKEVTPWIVAPAAEGLIEMSGPEHVVHAAAWQRGGEVLLIVVNSVFDPQTARLTLARPVTLRNALFESPPPRISGKDLQINLPSYGVGIYIVR